MEPPGNAPRSRGGKPARNDICPRGARQAHGARCSLGLLSRATASGSQTARTKGRDARAVGRTARVGVWVYSDTPREPCLFQVTWRLRLFSAGPLALRDRSANEQTGRRGFAAGADAFAALFSSSFFRCLLLSSLLHLSTWSARENSRALGPHPAPSAQTRHRRLVGPSAKSNAACTSRRCSLLPRSGRVSRARGRRVAKSGPARLAGMSGRDLDETRRRYTVAFSSGTPPLRAVATPRPCSMTRSSRGPAAFPRFRRRRSRATRTRCSAARSARWTRAWMRFSGASRSARSARRLAPPRARRGGTGARAHSRRSFREAARPEATTASRW